LNFLIKVLVNIHFALLDNRASFAPTPATLVLDLAVVVVCAALWTYFKTSTGRIIATTLLGIIMIAVALLLFGTYGVLSISFLIVSGVVTCMALDASYELLSARFRRTIVAEKHNAEFNILRHLNHNVKPAILMAKSPISAVTEYLEDRNLLEDVVAERLDGSRETVREALQHAMTSLEHISDILESTRKLVTHQIHRDEFQEVNIVELIEREIVPLSASKLAIMVQCDNAIKIRLHRQSFVEAILNLIRNAEVHGFPDNRVDAVLLFRIVEQRKRVVIDYTNNGRPFPENLSEKDFMAFGRKSSDSPGEGLGGAWIGKVVAAHNGTFEIIRDENPLHFRIKLPKRGA
jgi:signal transduction histidine kinase